MANIRILLLTLMSVQLIYGEKILAVFPSDVKSHFTLGKVVLTELANRGHEVCVYSSTFRAKLNEYCYRLHSSVNLVCVKNIKILPRLK